VKEKNRAFMVGVPNGRSIGDPRLRCSQCVKNTKDSGTFPAQHVRNSTEHKTHPPVHFPARCVKNGEHENAPSLGALSCSMRWRRSRVVSCSACANGAGHENTPKMGGFRTRRHRGL